MEAQAASTPLLPSASPVVLPSGNAALSQDEGNQAGAEKGRSVPAVEKEVQALPGNIQQTIGREGNTPDPVGASAASSCAVKEQAGIPSRVPAVPAVTQTSTTPCQTDTKQSGWTLLRPEHRVALPDIDQVGSRLEETSLDHIAKNMTLLYVEGRSLFQQARGAI